MKVATVFLFSALIAGSCPSATKTGEPCADALAGTLWMSVDDAWRTPPSYTSNPARYAPVHVLRFSPDGSFTMVACWVNTLHGKLHIMPGDGQAVFKGMWSVTNHDRLNVDYSLVSETVTRPNVKYPTPLEHHSLTCESHRSRITDLKEAGFNYHPISGLKMTEFQEYASGAK
jgi:hypothetical protein